WLWLALCRRTRQVVGFWLGRRTQGNCQALQWMIAPASQGCATVSDGLESYPVIFGARHRSGGKESGETVPVERFNNTVRQRLARVVRKTLSFSKSPSTLSSSSSSFSSPTTSIAPCATVQPKLFSLFRTLPKDGHTLSPSPQRSPARGGVGRARGGE